MGYDICSSSFPIPHTYHQPLLGIFSFTFVAMVIIFTFPGFGQTPLSLMNQEYLVVWKVGLSSHSDSGLCFLWRSPLLSAYVNSGPGAHLGAYHIFCSDLYLHIVWLVVSFTKPKLSSWDPLAFSPLRFPLLFSS